MIRVRARNDVALGTFPSTVPTLDGSFESPRVCVQTFPSLRALGLIALLLVLLFPTLNVPLLLFLELYRDITSSRYFSSSGLRPLRLALYLNSPPAMLMHGSTTSPASSASSVNLAKALLLKQCIGEGFFPLPGQSSPSVDRSDRTFVLPNSFAPFSRWYVVLARRSCEPLCVQLT
jgi:hypothetical protein